MVTHLSISILVRILVPEEALRFKLWLSIVLTPPPQAADRLPSPYRPMSFEASGRTVHPLWSQRRTPWADTFSPIPAHYLHDRRELMRANKAPIRSCNS